MKNNPACIAGLLLSAVLACSKETAPSPAGAAQPGEQGEHQGEGHGGEKHEEEGHEELPSRVQLPPHVLKASGVKLAPATLGVLSPAMDLSGEIAADPDRTAMITAQVPGRVVEVHAKEGQKVAAGAILATIESAELARARAAHTSASARATAARGNADRLASLAKEGLASGQEVAAAEAEAAALGAEVTAARQALSAFGMSALTPSGNAARLVLRAPIDG